MQDIESNLPKEVRNGQGTEEFVLAIKTFEKLRIQFSGVNCNDAFVELFFFCGMIGLRS